MIRKAIGFILSGKSSRIYQRILDYTIRRNKSGTETVSGLTYFYSPHNKSWSNERCIETSLGQAEAADDMLEVGNVLGSSMKRTWDCVDKYEKADGVINEDIVSYHSPKKSGRQLLSPHSNT